MESSSGTQLAAHGSSAALLSRNPLSPKGLFPNSAVKLPASQKFCGLEPCERSLAQIHTQVLMSAPRVSEALPYPMHVTAATTNAQIVPTSFARPGCWPLRLSKSALYCCLMSPSSRNGWLELNCSEAPPCQSEREVRVSGQPLPAQTRPPFCCIDFARRRAVLEHSVACHAARCH